MKKYQFVDRLIAILRKELEQGLPREAKLDIMTDKAKKIISKIIK